MWLGGWVLLGRRTAPSEAWCFPWVLRNNESADSCCLSPSEGGHGLADEERVNGVLIAGTVYRNSCQGRQAMNLQTLAALALPKVDMDWQMKRGSMVC